MFKQFRAALLIVSVSAIATAARADDFYVATNGDDTFPGTLAKPFRTMGRAQLAVGASGSAPDTVWIRGGTYYVAQNDSVWGPSGALTLSGTNTTWRAYVNAGVPEPVLIHGGQRLLSWTLESAPSDPVRRWRTTLPWTPDAQYSYPRDLYVNNNRMIRSRWPDRNLDANNIPQSSSFARVGVVSSLQDFTVDGPFPSPIAGHGYSHTGVLQMIGLHGWVSNRQEIDQVTINTVSGTTSVHTFNQVGGPGYSMAVSDRSYFEGAYEFLNQDSEWYYDPPTNQVWVMLHNPLDPNCTTQIVAPKSNTLWTVSQNSTNLLIHQLDFAFANFTDYLRPSGTPSTGWFPRGGGYLAYADSTAEYPLKGAIDFFGASNCIIQYCRIAHVGGSGLSIRAGVGNAAYVNEVFDTGGSGIYVGRVHMWDHIDCGTPWTLTLPSAAVTHSFVHDTGLVFQDAVGIKVDVLENTSIFYNYVRDTPYAAIHVGYGLGGDICCDHQRITPLLKNVYIAYNKIERPMLVLHDGGGIHMLDPASSCSVRQNRVFGLYGDPWAYLGGQQRRGLMMDQAFTYGWVVLGNVLHQPYATGTEQFLELEAYFNPCSYTMNFYPTTEDNFMDVNASGSACSGNWPPNGLFVWDLATGSSNPTAAAYRDAAGPSSAYWPWLSCACDGLVHPFVPANCAAVDGAR